MDASRFDRITRNLASGTSRRSLIKAAIGSVGGVAVASRLGSNANAARRGQAVPAPATPNCPGQQIPCGSSCCCPSGNDK
ncbi:MAG TPA: twin-arginine translocation signal domain-containing protein, partial [Thermomicrobiales bacterium]|nr:twin-arginine translocation signal domain-containing protein [Thermomicrobiales bacterium]